MKFILSFFLIGLSLNAQVGINTNTPQKTFHINGTLQLTSELNVGGDESMVGEPGSRGQALISQGSGKPPIWSSISNDVDNNTTTPTSQKIAAICIQNTSISGSANAYRNVIYNNTRTIQDFISTTDYTNYTVNKSGYYNLFFYSNSNITNGGGTYQGTINSSGSKIFSFLNNVAGGVTNLSDSTGGIVYLNAGDIISTSITFTRGFTILKSSLSIYYVGDF